MNEKEVILIVDDTATNRVLIKESLGRRYSYLEAGSGTEAIDLLLDNRKSISLIILDMVMPGVNGFGVLSWIRGRDWASEIPVIVLTSDDNETTINRVYDMGAVSYLKRPVQPSLLVHTVDFFIKQQREILENNERLKLYEQQVTHDSLTGLLNQVAYRQSAEHLLSEYPDKDYVMVVFDLDNFSEVNDEEGNEVGNRILIKAADIAEEIAGKNGFASRIGGDEFMIFMPLEEDIYALGERIKEVLAFSVEGRKMTASIGIVSSAYIGSKYNDMFLSADYALYTSKSAGAGQFTVYMKTEEEKTFKKMIAEEVAQGLSDSLPGGFFMYYANGSEELIYVNDALVKMFGCDNEEEFRMLVGNTFTGIVHPDDLENIENGIHTQINNENGAFDYVEYRIIRKDGSVAWVEDHGRYIYTDQYGYVYCVFIKEIEKNDENRIKLLLVEDDPLYMKSLSDMLKEAYLVEEAQNSAEAINRLDARGESFDMVLLDLNMATMDGFSVLEHMNRYGASKYIPVIAISYDIHSQSVNRAFNLGAIDVIAKPFVPSIVKRHIRSNIELAKKKNRQSPADPSRKRILIADASYLNSSFLTKILGDDYNIVYAKSAVEAEISILTYQDTLSLIILDLHMPEISGYELMDWMKSRGLANRIPVIAETMPEVYEENLHALYSGAADYISKPYQYELVRKRVSSIITAFETNDLIQSVKFDEITGVYTKQYFDYLLSGLLANDKTEYDIIWTNISGFKLLNDRYGSVTADSVLKHVADIINSMTEPVLVGRLNADHFLVVIEHVPEAAGKLAARIDKKLADAGDIPYVAMRYGIYENINRDLDLRQICDHAMFAGKNIKSSAESNIAYYDEALRTARLLEQKLSEQMVTALETEQFVVYYQPKFSLKTGKISGMEALVRWNSDKGFISPGDFIPLFEKNGFIRRLDEYMLQKVCRDIKEWEKKGLNTVPVSVNLSRRDFEIPDYTKQGYAEMEKLGVSADRIHVEVTESACADNFDDVVSQVEYLRDQGIKIEMDDFGSGFSSLGMLTDLPLDIVKLDISFIRNIDKKRKVVQSIIDLSHSLGYEVIAEGAETKEQVDALKGMGCDHVQGFFYSKPVSKEEVETYLK